MSSADKTYLVTGATGFTGGHLARHLRELGVTVRALVRDLKRARDLASLGIEVCEGTLEDRSSLLRATEGVYGIYHIAAAFREAGVPDKHYYNVNVEGTVRLLDAAIENGVHRFIYCSTNGVHGGIDNPPGDENSPIKPGDLYQDSKWQAEQIVREYFKGGKIGGVVIRPAMIYGPGDTRFLKMFRMIANGTFFYIGAGKALVHFIDVRDLACAFETAMQREHLNNQVYLIAGERYLTLKETVNMIAEMLGVRRPWLHLPLGPLQLLGEICERVCKPFGIEPPIYRRRVDFFAKHRAFDISRAKKDLDFKPAKPFEQELLEITNWYVNAGLIPGARASSPHLLRES